MKALRRYLATEGLVGEVPPWYTLIKAARYLGVPPWELAEKPLWWTHVALASQGAEATAAKHHRDRKASRNADRGRT